MNMYRIYWESSIHKGNGNPLTYSIANAWVIALNKKYPEIKHFLKKC